MITLSSSTVGRIDVSIALHVDGIAEEDGPVVRWRLVPVVVFVAAHGTREKLVFVPENQGI